MKPEVISSTLKKMVKHKYLRKLLTKKVDDYIYKNIVDDDSKDLQQVKIKRYQFLSAMMRCVNRNIDKGYISKQLMKTIIKVLVENTLICEDQSYAQAVEKYEKSMVKSRPLSLFSHLHKDAI